jgi:hypothetical protein
MFIMLITPFLGPFVNGERGGKGEEKVLMVLSKGPKKQSVFNN